MMGTTIDFQTLASSARAVPGTHLEMFCPSPSPYQYSPSLGPLLGTIGNSLLQDCAHASKLIHITVSWWGKFSL